MYSRDSIFVLSCFVFYRFLSYCEVVTDEKFYKEKVIFCFMGESDLEEGFYAAVAGDKNLAGYSARCWLMQNGLTEFSEVSEKPYVSQAEKEELVARAYGNFRYSFVLGFWKNNNGRL